MNYFGREYEQLDPKSIFYFLARAKGFDEVLSTFMGEVKIKT